MLTEESPDGIGLCRFSCCLSFVVVIFVRSPATISMMSVMGIPLISYFNVGSSAVLRLPDCPLKDKNSSVAKLCICARSRTLIVFPPYFCTSSKDRFGCACASGSEPRDTFESDGPIRGLGERPNGAEESGRFS